MRIIQVAPLPPYQGGAETIGGQVSEQLVERGHELIWYCLSQSLSYKSAKEVRKGVLVKEFRPLFWDPLYIPQREFVNELRREDADIIHIHNLHTLLPIITIIPKKNSSARIVLQPHYHAYGQNITRSILFSIYKKFLKLVILQHFSAIIVNSEYEQMVFKRDFPELSQKVALIPEAYSIEIPPDVRWKPRTNPKSILYVGALRVYKNVDKLLQAFKILASKLNGLELTIVGEGAQKEELMKLALNLGIDSFITWKRDLTYGELLKEYTEASVVVLLSSLESFSRVAHEAIAIGIPLVVYEYGALKTLANEGLAKGVKDLNPMKIAKALETVIEHRWKRKNSESPLHGESYVDSIVKLYSSLLGTKDDRL